MTLYPLLFNFFSERVLHYRPVAKPKAVSQFGSHVESHAVTFFSFAFFKLLFFPQPPSFILVPVVFCVRGII